MATTYNDNGGARDGSNKEYTFTFPYLKTEDVYVALNGVTQATTKYTVSTSPTKITFNNTSIDSSVQESTGAPKSGVTVRVFRDTDVDTAKAVYAVGSSIRAGDLNDNQDQCLYALQEEQNQLETLTDADINPAAEIQVSKLKDGTARQLLQTDAAGTGVEWTSNIDVPGTLDVTGAVDFDGNLNVDGTLTVDGVSTLTGNVTVGGTVDGRDVAADGTKLDGIETAATADQTNAEIRAAVEAATDSNVFTDADHTKLNAIEASATADQTNAEIRAAVEAATDSNVFTDADHSKLNAIEASATADQTGAEIKVAYEAESNTNAYTDAEKTKLAAIDTSADVTDATTVNAAGAVMNSDLATKGQIVVGDGSGDPTILSVGTNNHVLVADSNEASGVKWATTPAGSGLSNVVEDTTPQLGGDLDVNGNDIVSTSNGAINITPNGSGDVIIDGLKYPQADGSAGQFLKTNGSAQLSWAVPTDTNTQLSNAEVRTAVEAATDSNVFTDADHTKLNAIEASADVTDATNVNAAGAIMEADVDAKGDILAATADNTVARLAVGSNTQVLTADSSTSTGLAWAAASSGTITALNNQAANRLTTIGSTTTQLDGEASLTFEDTTSTGLISGKQITGRGFECPATVSDDWTIAAGNNAMFPGPMTVAANKTVTVPANRTLTVV